MGGGDNCSDLTTPDGLVELNYENLSDDTILNSQSNKSKNNALWCYDQNNQRQFRKYMLQ